MRGIWKMKILISGSTGMLGSDCKRVLSEGHEIIAPDKEKMDIISWDGVIENLEKRSPEVIVNCVGFNNLEACETESFAVRKVNVEGPRNLAQCSARFQYKLVHISCDHVFDGRKMMPQPYFEDDTPNPLSAYGKSKMESETAVRENAPNYIVLRTGWLYGPEGNNFLKSIVAKCVQKGPKSIPVPNDQFGSPTWSYEVALQIKELLEHDGRGTYHATAEGFCSRFEYAKYIVKKLELEGSIKACKMNEQKGAVREPANALLENRLLKKQGIHVMHHWKEALDAFLETYGDELVKAAKAKKP